jgi:hypothetical protein
MTKPPNKTALLTIIIGGAEPEAVKSYKSIPIWSATFNQMSTPTAALYKTRQKFGQPIHHLRPRILFSSFIRPKTSPPSNVLHAGSHVNIFVDATPTPSGVIRELRI